MHTIDHAGPKGQLFRMGGCAPNNIFQFGSWSSIVSFQPSFSSAEADLSLQPGLHSTHDVTNDVTIALGIWNPEPSFCVILATNLVRAIDLAPAETP